ncbi:hypothetical protein [Candidatus Nitrosotenuis uzonensis]|uniref:GRAM domain-containing protein n=1 Tax=Candidatus Nitrosotenuis uzonensis TaxID=1407055 RepID=A0A812ETV3_9ARCH|nr:hypothetical protein [Candidatus Nitrosotenuis uzonensis]CAE6485801.1 conserved hypothetical protein [Candidatus Nitrosotenuis uzonensis]
MISLKNGEKITKSFDAKSKLGNGILYITNLGIVFEAKMKGLILELPFTILRTFEAKKKNILLLSWDEPDKSQRFSLECKVEHAKAVENEIQLANQEFASKTSDF